jgi:hypothetical protein
VQRLTLALLVAVVVLGRAPVAGAEPTPSDRVEADTARDLFRQGRDLYKKNQIAEAHAKFVAAFAVKKHWQIALNLGATELLLGRYREAAEHLTWAERESANAPEDSDIRWLRERMPEALQHVATVHVLAEAGCQLQIDDDPSRLTPVDLIFVDPGHHELSVRSAGRKPTYASLELAAGESRQVDLTLPVETAGGSDPAADADRSAEAVPAETGGMSARTIVAISGGALALVGVGVGLYFTAKADSADSDADRLRSSVTARFGDPNAPGGPTGPGCTVTNDLCSALSNAVYDRATAAEHARAAFVTAGVLAGATVGAWIFWPRNEAPSAKTGVRFGTNGHQVWLQGTF